MKIGIMACDFVGSATALVIAIKGKANALILVDLNAHLARAGADDILHAMPLSEQMKIAAAALSFFE